MSSRRTPDEPGQVLYQAIFDSAVDFAVVTTDHEGRITAWNAGAERILGWSSEEMIGQPFATFFTPEDRATDQPAAEMRRTAETGRAADERWHLRKDGSRFWASGALMHLRTRGGADLASSISCATAPRRRHARARRIASATSCRSSPTPCRC